MVESVEELLEGTIRASRLASQAELKCHDAVETYEQSIGTIDLLEASYG